MAPIRLPDDQPETSCLGNVFSKLFSKQEAPAKKSLDEKFVYSAVDPMEQLPPYEDCIRVNMSSI
jgi:hypothetical protein